MPRPPTPSPAPRRLRRAGMVLLVLGAAGLTAAAVQAGRGWSTRQDPPEPPWFEEVALQVGLDFEHLGWQTRRFWIPENVFAGACGLDFDGDGHLDCYLVQGGDLQPGEGPRPGNRLYRNRGDGTFVDVTAAAGVGDTGYGCGCTAADYDADGDTDLYVTNLGANVLYRNEGDGTFADVTEAAGVGDPGWGASAAFADLDGDGDLDLFVTNYVDWSPALTRQCSGTDGERDYCAPGVYQAPSVDVLYRNQGDGTFADVTRAAGIDQVRGTGLGVVPLDADGDGRMDLFVANDGMPNALWMNQGDGTFLDDALLAGCALNGVGRSEAGMGVAAVDIENDGDPDLFLAHLGDETNTLYVNRGGRFDDRTAGSGLGGPSLCHTGFGLGFADLDCDGELDLYVANGGVIRHFPAPRPENAYAEEDLLFRGLGEGRFQPVSPPGGTAEPWYAVGRSVVTGDFDDDGDLDLLVMNNQDRVRLLRNVAPRRGSWILLRLLDRRGVDALGARVLLAAGGRAQHRWVQPACGFASSNDPRVHFGLGEARQADRIQVLWPDGSEEHFGPLAAGILHEIVQGTGR